MPVRLDTGEARTPAISSGPPEARRAAVLALIVPMAAAAAGGPPDAGIVLIRRTDRGGVHAGDIALPGGRSEPEDADAAATAVREAGEEIGLDPGGCGLRVLGELETFWIPVSDYRVTPVVAVTARMPAMRPQPTEVAAIHVAPLAAFRAGAPIELVETTVRGFPLRFGAYPLDGYRVWGATARILGQLGAVLGPA
jgi:8-oxo-dGTP pyrophosphatase MutT (NUDIX family)